MLRIQRRDDHTAKLFWKRTISAQLHLIGSLAALIGCMFLLQTVFHHPSSLHFWACLAFGLTSILVFFTSSVYHFLSDGYLISPRLEQMLEDLDHYAIYLFIAGTYTPFIVNAIAPPWNHILLIVIWITGFTGILYTFLKPRLPLWARHRFFSTGIFLLMGWVLLIRLGEVVNNISRTAVFLLVAGGISYSIGAAVYATKRPKFFEGVFGFHEIWHIMVMIGFAFHYTLIIQFYL